MDNNWAAQHLQTIRILMERSALYRRALAPVYTFVGVAGILAAIIASAMKIQGVVAFACYWMSVGVLAVVGALLLVRRQALKQGESFWSPPARRVAQGMAPALLVGFVAGCKMIKMYSMHQSSLDANSGDAFPLVVIWTLLYGLALHAAAFFTPRGIRLFGWAFLLIGMGFITFSDYVGRYWNVSPNCNMGVIFGASHLAYGIYLYFTEQRVNET